MKFKAHIKLPGTKHVELAGKKHIDIEFTFQDLAEQVTLTGGYLLFAFREILIPWLLAGNQPDIIFSDEELQSALKLKNFTIFAPTEKQGE